MAAAVTTIAVASVSGGIVTFYTSGDRADVTLTSDRTTPSTPSTEISAPISASGTTASGTPAKTTVAPAADPRTIRIPKDPLVGVANPAYRRAGDETQPHPDEWRASTTAGSPEERDTETAIRDQMTSMLTTKDMNFMKPAITFNQRAQTVMVTGGPVPQVPENHQEVFRRAGEMAACSALAHRLKNDPTTWNANTAETNEDGLSLTDGISLGFDPVEHAAYVWTDNPNSRFTSHASQSNLRGTVEEAVCRKLTLEFHNNKSWEYTRWSVAVYDAYTGTRQLIGAGTCPS
ncbi:hypothetical protein [Streptomyces sp. NPDC002057]|uniref:hypothetical protein n=1 Tax=Streptomyces sp. NPDC002057 TaxID=3154664 RepID=UPI00332843CB